MSCFMVRQALKQGAADLRKHHASWSSNHSTFIVIAIAAVTVLLGSVLFIQSSRYLPKDLNGSAWVVLQQARNLAMISNSDVEQYFDADDDYPVDQPIALHSRSNCSKEFALLKVFMYDLPPEFHFGMLDDAYSNQIWPSNISDVPRYAGGLNLQHSIEYWLTLDLLSSVLSDRASGCTAILVEDPKEADIFFVPYFSSLSYNKYTRLESGAGMDKNVQLQEKLVRILRKKPHWRLSGGKNHVIVMHHPNSLHVARERLCSAIFIVSDFGRYSSQVANVYKDIVAPYRHMVPTFVNDTSSFQSRKTFLFFQGAIVRKEGGIIRQQLYQMLKSEIGVHFSDGIAQKGGVQSATEGMRSSKFCLHLAGDTPSSNRLFDAIVSHCVPVIISDEIELPFEDQLDYSRFCIFVTSENALQSGFVMGLLRSVKEEEWTRKWMLLKQLDHLFEYRHPSQPDDAVNMIWRTLARKMQSVRLSLNKARRYSRSRSFLRTIHSRL